jgi:hypothetical protein
MVYHAPRLLNPDGELQQKIRLETHIAEASQVDSVLLSNRRPCRRF